MQSVLISNPFVHNDFHFQTITISAEFKWILSNGFVCFFNRWAITISRPDTLHCALMHCPDVWVICGNTWTSILGQWLKGNDQWVIGIESFVARIWTQHLWKNEKAMKFGQNIDFPGSCTWSFQSIGINIYLANDKTDALVHRCIGSALLPALMWYESSTCLPCSYTQVG